MILTQWPPGDLFFPSGDEYWETWMLQVQRFNADGGRWCYYFSLNPGRVALWIYRKGVYCQNLCRPGLYQTIFQQLYLAKLLWTPGGYSWEFLVGVCCLVLQILTRFQTKEYNFPYPFSDQTSKMHTRFQTWPFRQKLRYHHLE